MHPAKPTLKDVARVAGVSDATVSRVFSGADKVSPETVKRVRQAAKKLSYTPNRLARSLRKQQSRNLGLVLPGFDNVFYLEFIAEAVELGAEYDYSVLVTGSSAPEKNAVQLSQSGTVDALLIVASHNPDPDVLRQIEVPTVGLDRALPGAHLTTFQVDNQDGATQITRHLIAQGAKRIAFIQGPEHIDSAEKRFSSFKEVLKDAGIPFEEKFVIRGDFHERSGRTAVRRLLEKKDSFDAIFAANDLMALGAIHELSENGINVPGDVLVAGFDGITQGEFIQPTLATYRQPVRLIARRALEEAMRLTKGETHFTPGSISQVKGELVLRTSIATPVSTML